MADDENTTPDERTVQMGKLAMQVPPEVATGVYSNVAMINHTPEDFVVDFAFVEPGGNRGSVRARVILTPGHFKRLLKAMEANLKRYEQTFGKVPEHAPPVPTQQGPVN